MLFALISPQYKRLWEEPNIMMQKARVQVFPYAKEFTRF